MRFRASFTVTLVTDDIIFIVDNDDGSKSVTNDAEHVCYEIHQTWPGKRIVYRDTMGRWDELVHEKGTFVRFAPFKEDARIPRVRRK